jgi:hypothetical protein
MTKIKPMKIYNLLMLLICVNVSFAQSTTAKISTVKTDGLHKIILLTNVRSASNDDLSDFRIFDSKANEVPYFYRNIKDEMKYSNYVPYKIISETVIPKKQTTIIFENPEESISFVRLSIANYEGEKSYNLSGSNDQKKWYGLSNNNILSDLNTPEDLNTIKTISFPLNNYKFLKIELNDKKSLPISIQGIGKSDTQTIKTDLLPVNYINKEITELKLDKKTKIHIQFDSAQFLSQIQFEIAEPKLYKRMAIIYKLETQKVKHKEETFQKEIASFELSSDAKNILNLSDIHEKDFYIEIQNQDNQPLKISDVKFFQIPVFVVSDLKANENYTIKTGNPKLRTPVYDIENFKNSIPDNLPIATITNIESKNTQQVVMQAKSFWQQPWFMWVCISLGGIVILYFASSLVKDLNKNNK